jgi:hypothetical protein
MFDLLITLANRQLSGITSRYALRAVDLKNTVVIDLWNAGEERPVETLSGGESFADQPAAEPGVVRTEQRAVQAGIIVSGRGLRHTGQRDPGCCLKRTGTPVVIWQDHWCDQPYRPAYPAHAFEDRCEITGVGTSTIHVKRKD